MIVKDLAAGTPLPSLSLPAHWHNQDDLHILIIMMQLARTVRRLPDEHDAWQDTSSNVKSREVDLLILTGS